MADDSKGRANVSVRRAGDVTKPAKVPGKTRRGGRFTSTRRDEVVRKTAQLFLERGYDEVTIDHVVAEVGASKATVYARFGGKAELFVAVIEEYCGMISAGIEEAELDLTGSLEEQLCAIGNAFLELILRPETLELHRLVISISDRFPGVAQVFFNAGPASAYKIAANWMRHQQEAGELIAESPDALAVLFLDMLTGDHQLRRLLSIGERPEAASVRQTVELAARVFLRGARRQP